VSMLAERSE